MKNFYKKETRDLAKNAEVFGKHETKQIVSHAKITHPDGNVFEEITLEDDTKVTFENGQEKSFDFGSKGKYKKAK